MEKLKAYKVRMLVLGDRIEYSDIFYNKEEAIRYMEEMEKTSYVYYASIQCVSDEEIAMEAIAVIFAWVAVAFLYISFFGLIILFLKSIFS